MASKLSKFLQGALLQGRGGRQQAVSGSIGAKAISSSKERSSKERSLEEEESWKTASLALVFNSGRVRWVSKWRISGIGLKFATSKF